MDSTPRQQSAQLAYKAAQKAYRLAWPGQKQKMKDRLHDAATEVVASDVEAERIAKMEAA